MSRPASGRPFGLRIRLGPHADDFVRVLTALLPSQAELRSVVAEDDHVRAEAAPAARLSAGGVRRPAR